jgi:hypothetical protein
MDPLNSDRLYSENLSESKWPRGDAPAPDRAEGVSLGQAMREWGIRQQVLYRLEQAGRLLGMRVGNRVIYSRAQLVQLLGEPSNPDRPPRLKRLGQSTDVSGRQLSFGELADAAAAA